MVVPSVVRPAPLDWQRIGQRFNDLHHHSSSMMIIVINVKRHFPDAAGKMRSL
jgi:hypothetical protein